MEGGADPKVPNTFATRIWPKMDDAEVEEMENGIKF